MLSNHVILCCPILLCLRFPQHRGFSNESALCIRWPKYWSFSFSITLSNEYSGLISLGLTGSISLQSKGLKSLLQHHSSKASILWHSAFFMVQLSHPLLPCSPPALIFSSIMVFSNELALHILWPKYWSFSISPSNEYSGLISFKDDWFDLLSVQGTQESSPAPQF